MSKQTLALLHTVFFFGLLQLMLYLNLERDSVAEEFLGCSFRQLLVRVVVSSLFMAINVMEIFYFNFSEIKTIKTGLNIYKHPIKYFNKWY